MDAATYDEVRGPLLALLTRLGDRVAATDLASVAELVEAGEPGVALEQVADVLGEDAVGLTRDERDDMLDLAWRMQMDDRVWRALSGCPTRPSRLSTGASGALRRFAGWVARGSVGHPLLEGVDYWDDLRESPSQMETMFAIFANNLRLDADGTPLNEKYAERRAACWLVEYCTGSPPRDEPPLESWETELY